MLNSNTSLRPYFPLSQTRMESKHDNHNMLFDHLAQSTRSNQWIWFTSNSIRPSVKQLALFNIPINRVLQLKASLYLSEFEVAQKAIKSENASALVISNKISNSEQKQLINLGEKYQCQIFVVNRSSYQYH